MRGNLYDEDDPGLITKKLWSHFKSNFKFSRLPETMHLYDTFRNKPSEKAELFDNYFYEQFSGPSNYNSITLVFIFQTIKYLVSISIEIECIVHTHLYNINCNKARWYTW